MLRDVQIGWVGLSTQWESSDPQARERMRAVRTLQDQERQGARSRILVPGICQPRGVVSSDSPHVAEHDVKPTSLALRQNES